MTKLVPRIQQAFEEARKGGRDYLLEPEAKAVCIERGIPCARFLLARNIDEAIKSAESIGYPVVLKIVSPSILHKSDVGGVVTDVRNVAQLRASYRDILANVKKQMPDVEITGMLVEEMIPPSTEVVVGATKNSQFGSVIMFGLGGVFVEILKDVSFRAAPIDANDALEMITELRAYSILKGYRNRPPADIDALIDILLRVSTLVVEYPEIGEIDLNPILSSGEGTKVVDARILLGVPSKA